MQSHAESLLALQRFTPAAATKQNLDRKFPRLFPSLQETLQCFSRRQRGQNYAKYDRMYLMQVSEMAALQNLHRQGVTSAF